jgi:glycerol-3-phosphate dehydrogenase (NAD(P)+)
VPSQGFREVIMHAEAYIRPWIPVVSLTKGFEKDTMLRMTQVIKQVLPGHPAAALTGPNLAKEIMAGLAAASVMATEDMAVASKLQEVLHLPLFRLYTNDDVIGCEVAGALKNVIAIAAGMAEGLSAGDNTRAAVISRGLAELTRLGVAMGGHPSTFSGLAGMGDLIATCMSPQSRNRYVGEQLGRGRKLDEILVEMNMVAEGVKTAGTVVALAEQYGVEMPICSSINDVIWASSTAVDAYSGVDFRGRPDPNAARSDRRASRYSAEGGGDHPTASLCGTRREIPDTKDAASHRSLRRSAVRTASPVDGREVVVTSRSPDLEGRPTCSARERRPASGVFSRHRFGFGARR